MRYAVNEAALKELNAADIKLMQATAMSMPAGSLSADEDENEELRIL